MPEAPPLPDGPKFIGTGKFERTVPPPSSRIIGIEDRGSEARFGKINFNAEAVNNIGRLSRLHAGSEIGGLLVGWEENGVKQIVDSLVYIPEDKLVGKYILLNGMKQMLWALDKMKENPAYGGHDLEVLGWWHTHPAEKVDNSGSAILSAFPPVPTGGQFENGTLSGDLGLTKYLSTRFKKTQEMLIIQVNNENAPVNPALWRWDNTENSESAHFQSGISIQGNNELENVNYWQLPLNGQKSHDLHIKNEDIVKLNIDDSGDLPPRSDVDFSITEADLPPSQQQDAAAEIKIIDSNLPPNNDVDFIIRKEDLLPENGPDIRIIDTDLDLQQADANAVIDITDLDLDVATIDLRDLKKPGIRGLIEKVIDKAKGNLPYLKNLKDKIGKFLIGPYDANTKTRISIDEILEELDRMDLNDQIKIIDEDKK